MDIFKRLRKNKPIAADSVRFGYEDEDVLKDITISVKEGKITSIIGQSGSGKSTFLKLISGIISKRHIGSIKVFGKAKIFQKSKIGYVPQELSYIPDLTIEDNIKISGLNLGISEKKALTKAKDLLKLLRLEVELSKKPTQLSGGQKARLNIILSLLHNPKIVVLDEPFVGLDFYNRKLLWHFIESMKKKKKSIILTSHLLSETQEYVDRMIILKNGKVFFNGKLESLKTKLHMQFVFEVRCLYLSNESFSKIKKYCDYNDIKILDRYNRYLMFALKSVRTRNALFSLFKKLKLQYDIIGFREPNLDEVFLKT